MKKDKNNPGNDATPRRAIKAVEYTPETDSSAPKIEDKSESGGQKNKKIRHILPVKTKKPHDEPVISKTKEKGTFAFFWRNVLWPFFQPVASILIGICIVVLVCLLAFKFAYKNYISPVDSKSTEQIDIVIEKDDTLSTIAAKLEKAGVIRNSKVFKYYVDFSDMSSKLLAGKFTLSPSMTLDDIISVLKRSSAAQNTTRVTFAEGALTDTYANLLTQEGALENDGAFLDQATSGTDYSKYWFIKEVLEKEATTEKSRKYMLEGYLFPDTYEFYISSTADQVMERLLGQFEKVFTNDYKERAQQLGMSVDDVIILASMIEKEAKEDDFKKVSAVFHNRLDAGMPLQSCATMQYFMEEKKFSYNSEELKTDSPYNTYLYSGLPVGPICNPGKAAIEAALWPEPSYLGVYYYFCLGDPKTGETVFSKTYEEHLQNQAKYESLWG